MSGARPALPEYAHPPLVAATLGVFFETPIDITATELEAYQQRLSPEWAGDWSEVSLRQLDWITDIGLMSCGWQLNNVLHDRVIRISPMHFAFTWLGTADSRYPRYEALRDGFVAAWDLFAVQQRLTAEQLGQWSVSYLNRIPQGTVWQQPADWTFWKLMPDAPRCAQQIPSASWQFQLPELPAGLSIDWNYRATSTAVDEPTVWLRLTSCGKITSESSALLDGMDAGRAAIVQIFSDLLSPAANAYWGLRRREK